MPAGPISRPSQGSGRRGGKGGLGFKRGGGGFGGPRATEGGSGKEASIDSEKKPAKSNADFKAMFLKGKPESSNDDKKMFEVSS
jgi:squamous cell carcinoma antigen recognized by T-cells 3